MSKAMHTKGPWTTFQDSPFEVMTSDGENVNALVATISTYGTDTKQALADARLIAAAPELLEAALLQEKAETSHANCDECDGEEIPELCTKCFPLFDDARIKRRAVIAKATGGIA